MNIEETRDQSRNELGTRREAKRGRYKKKLTDEDYMGMEEYDFKLFTVQDYKAYKEVLEAAPYNWEAVKGTKFEIPVMLAAFYGLRRSEVLGLKWDAVDFDKNTITIKHTVTTCELDGKRILVKEDRTKNKASMRTLPLVDFVKEKLLSLKAEQEENRMLCGRSYIKDFIGYICINEIGDLIKPGYLSVEFPKLLEKKGLRRIRFHDLRHSCASLLIANGVPMKQIQEWLGHSDFSTTANIYAHLDYSSKLSSADALLGGLGLS